MRDEVSRSSEHMSNLAFYWSGAVTWHRFTLPFLKKKKINTTVKDTNDGLKLSLWEINKTMHCQNYESMNRDRAGIQDQSSPVEIKTLWTVQCLWMKTRSFDSLWNKWVGWSDVGPSRYCYYCRWFFHMLVHVLWDSKVEWRRPLLLAGVVVWAVVHSPSALRLLVTLMQPRCLQAQPPFLDCV